MPSPVFTENQYTNVTYNEKFNTIEVEKITETLRDGIVIAATPNRKAYSESQKQELVAEVTTGSDLATFYGWE